MTPTASSPVQADAPAHVRGALAPVSRLRAVTPGRPAVDLEVVVPAFNEERRLPETLAATVAHLAELPVTSAVVVVDNGSVDSTADVVDRYGNGTVAVHVIGCASKGKGSAVRRGIATSRARWVGYMDADLATPITTLDVVLPLLQDGATCVIASRHVPGASFEVEQPALRRAGGMFFRALGRVVVHGVHDTQCGFKFFDGDLVRDVLRRCHLDGFAFDLELLAQIQRGGHRVVEVPVRWRDADGSTFRPLQDGMQATVDVLRLKRLLDAHSS